MKESKKAGLATAALELWPDGSPGQARAAKKIAHEAAKALDELGEKFQDLSRRFENAKFCLDNLQDAALKYAESLDCTCKETSDQIPNECPRFNAYCSLLLLDWAKERCDWADVHFATEGEET